MTNFTHESRMWRAICFSDKPLVTGFSAAPVYLLRQS